MLFLVNFDLQVNYLGSSPEALKGTDLL